MKKRIISVVLIVLLIAPALHSQVENLVNYGIESNGSNPPKGLKPGDRAPLFSGYDQNGKYVESGKLLEKGPLVLFFYRGKWCPVCNRYLSSYQDSLDIIKDQGVSVVAVTPESIENAEQTVKAHDISFTVIYDCQEKIMKDFDVMFKVTKDYQEKVFKKLNVDIAKNNGRDEANLPVPATYIINRSGTIVAVHFDPDFHNRASVKWILQNIGRAF